MLSVSPSVSIYWLLRQMKLFLLMKHCLQEINYLFHRQNWPGMCHKKVHWTPTTYLNPTLLSIEYSLDIYDRTVRMSVKHSEQIPFEVSTYAVTRTNDTWTFQLDANFCLCLRGWVHRPAFLNLFPLWHSKVRLHPCMWFFSYMQKANTRSTYNAPTFQTNTAYNADKVQRFAMRPINIFSG